MQNSDRNRYSLGRFVSNPLRYGGFHVCKTCGENKECTPENYRLMNVGKKCESVSKECRKCQTVKGHKRHKKMMENKEFAEKRKKTAKSWRERNRLKVMLNNYISIDEKKGMTCTLTQSDLERITSMPCHYCGDTNRIGIDRINNKMPHTAENSLPCCVECNVARSDHFTTEEMMIIGSAIREVKRKRE